MSNLGRRIRPHPMALLIAVLALGALAVGSADALVRPPHSSSLPYRINAALSPDSRENTSVIVQNNSSRPTTIVMDFYTPPGVMIPLASQIHTDVPGWSTRTFAQALNQGLLPGFRGVGVLSSDQPLNALLLREVTGPEAGRSYSIHNADAGSGVRVALPYVANQLAEGDDGSILNTRFSIANASLEVACVTITYQLMPGRGSASAVGGTSVVSSPSSDVCPEGGHEIAPAGQLTLAPGSGDMVLGMPASTVNSLMSVIIDSTKPVTVAADIYRGDSGSAQLGSYDGFLVAGSGSSQDDISRRVILPLAQKMAGGYWTEFAITNPWNQPVSGTIVYEGKVAGQAGSEVEVTIDIEVPAGGGITHSVLDSEALPAGFTGWATVRADEPVAVLLLRAKSGSSGTEHSYAAANGVPWGRASTSAKFPLIFRNAHGEGDARGYNSWLSIAVEDGGTANIRIVAVNNPTSGAEGCEILQLYQTSFTITGSALFDQGSSDRKLTGLDARPECLTGGMAITSDKPIVAIGGVTSDLQSGDNDGLYNAFR